MCNKVFVKTGKVDDKGTPYVISIDEKFKHLFPEDNVLDWVKL